MQVKSRKGGVAATAVAVLAVLALVAVAPTVRAAPLPTSAPVYEGCFTGGPSHLLVFFDLNNQAGLSRYLNAAYYQPFSPWYHQFLSAAQFDAEYAAPSWVFGTVASILAFNGLTPISSGPMLYEAGGTDVQVGNALDQLAATPGIQPYLIGAECMPETFNAQSTHASAPDLVRGDYVGGSPYSNRGGSSCTDDETDSIGVIWLPCGLETIYGDQPLLTDYSHQTIALIDAYGDLNPAAANLPTPVYDNLACSDLAVFDTTFSLPTANCQIIYPTGVPRLGPNNVGDAEGWGPETGIDTQYAHVMAPGAHILEVTSSTDYDDLYASVEYVVNHQLANIISMSWGNWEDLYWCTNAEYGCSPPATPALLLGYDEIFEQAAAQGISVFASSADYAAYDPNFEGYLPPYGEVSTETPATDPWVSGVGGTTLNATFTGGTVVRQETAWSLGSDSYCTVCGSGGGFSFLFPETAGQKLVHISTQVASVSEPALGLTFYPQGQRGVPDLAADGDPSSGVLIIQNGTFSPYVWGGTSLATPLTAGMVSSIQGVVPYFQIGDLAPTLYELYAQEGHGFYVPQGPVSLRGLTYGIPGSMFETSGGQNGEYYVTPGVWNPVAGLGQLNAYGLSQVIAQVGYGGSGYP